MKVLIEEFSKYGTLKLCIRGIYIHEYTHLKNEDVQALTSMHSIIYSGRLLAVDMFGKHNTRSEEIIPTYVSHDCPVKVFALEPKATVKIKV